MATRPSFRSMRARADDHLLYFTLESRNRLLMSGIKCYVFIDLDCYSYRYWDHL
jgi:hypothetical protein